MGGAGAMAVNISGAFNNTFSGFAISLHLCDSFL
jgi:hypothetical protein